MAMDPIFVSVQEAAKVLGLSRASMYALCDQQVVETRYKGRRRLVVVESLKAYAESLPRYPPEAAS